MFTLQLKHITSTENAESSLIEDSDSDDEILENCELQSKYDY